MWQEGPQFLKTPEVEWPTKRSVRCDIAVPELKQKFVGVVTAIIDTSVLDCFSLERFSKWKLLVNTTARVLLVCKRFKNPNWTRLEPNASDIEEASVLWIKHAQQKLNLKELKKNQSVH